MADSPPSRKPRLAAAAAAAAAAEEEPDALASLPLEVLDNILSRLHIYDVVRTSALSRAWRRRWESLPTVDLTRGPGISASDVDALLLRRAAPVRAFRLRTRDPSWKAGGAFHDWLLWLSRRGVRDLHLALPRAHGFLRLHSCLFSCRELTRLSLHTCCMPPPPAGLAGFPNLKTLRLEKVLFRSVDDTQGHTGRELAALIAGSPVLEDLELVFVILAGDGPEEEWMIQAPNLRRLLIVSPFDYGGRTENLPLLKEAILFGPNYAKFLTGMGGITKLDFHCTSIRPTEVDELEKLSFLFENLRSLSVAVNFCTMSQIFSMFCLLRSAPVLEELDVWGWSDGAQEMESNHEFLYAQCVDNMFAKLHVVRMKKFTYLTNEMHFMEFILSKARVLQVLCVTLASYAPCSNEEIITEIAEYPRASPDAQVIFMGREPESANDESEGFLTTSTEDSDGETQRDEARPRRRQLRNFESVAQVDQLLEKQRELGTKREQVLQSRLRLNKEITALYKDFGKYNDYFNAAIQLLRKPYNIIYPGISDGASAQPSTCASARSSDCLGTSKPEGTPMGTGLSDADGYRADPPVDRVLQDAASAHVNPLEDNVLNSAADPHAETPADLES
ncbi:hypothetical protein ACP4OV_017782 [Aristida adscensionis]